MEHTPSLYETLVQVRSPHPHGLDVRHLTTVAWRRGGLSHSTAISLCAWPPFVVSRAP